MDLSQYLKKSSSGHSRFNIQREKYCLECGKQMQDDGSHLFLQCFCSPVCKQRYVDSVRK